MSNNWQKVYSEIEEHIAKNPQIKISKNVIAIPRDVRPEFYRLFDQVRVAFLKEKCQTLLNEADMLSSNYAQAVQVVTKSLRLSHVKVPDRLNWFLNDPIKSLSRSIYDPLFDLLKGEADLDAFEGEAKECIERSFRDLFRSGYEKWVVLSLVNLLIPDMALVIPFEDIQERCPEIEDDQHKGHNEERVPKPKEMEILSFGRDFIEEAFIISDLIVRSTRLSSYVSIGADLANASWTATEVSSKREWLQIRSIGGQYVPIFNWPDLVVYIDDNPEDIALVADFSRFCRPDVIVECMEQADWYQKGGLEEVKQNYDFFKPKLGSYVVSRLPVPEEVLKDFLLEPMAAKTTPEKNSLPKEEPKGQHRNIHILTVGYEQSRLAPVIDVLSSASKIP